jgi:hypothetical protein
MSTMCTTSRPPGQEASSSRSAIDDRDLPLVAVELVMQFVDHHGAGGPAAEDQQALHVCSCVRCAVSQRCY